jgi:hypothetical protein
LNSFVEIYSVFEGNIKAKYPSVEIMIENRCGSIYSGGKFAVSKKEDIYELCNLIDKNNLGLKIAFDIPQLYTAHNITNKKASQYSELLVDIEDIRQYIGGVHLWGKGYSQTGRRIAHYGDLNSYFENDLTIKNEFISSLKNCFNDDVVRKLVLEVNSSNQDLTSIISDLTEFGFLFV